ncbi:MAG: response regulator transcription factor [Micrococcus sp.]|nr:response regulator transcription factor [Micrococcus sp.]
MARLLLLSGSTAPVLEALAFLDHRVTVAPARAESLLRAPETDVVLVDARRDLAGARGLCQVIRTASHALPVLPILTEGGLAALSPAWGTTDFLLDTAGPAEVSARLRLSVARAAADVEGDGSEAEAPIRASGVTVDAASYTAKVHGEPLNLTFKEFELLKHLVQHPGRVFTREQLLHEVWGYDYFGGTRTVDVHVRRLRAKLGPDQEQLIGTVRNVGYRFVPRETEPGQAPDG